MGLITQPASWIHQMSTGPAGRPNHTWRTSWLNAAGADAAWLEAHLRGGVQQLERPVVQALEGVQLGPAVPRPGLRQPSQAVLRGW